MAIGNIAYVYLVVPGNYSGGTVTATLTGGITASIATSTTSTGTYTALSTLTPNTGYYFRVTATNAANFLGLSLVFS